MAHKRPGYPSLSDDLIDLKLKNMRRTDPKTTREMAIKELESLQERYRYINLDDPEGFRELDKTLRKKKKMKTN